MIDNLQIVREQYEWMVGIRKIQPHTRTDAGDAIGEMIVEIERLRAIESAAKYLLKVPPDAMTAWALLQDACK